MKKSRFALVPTLLLLLCSGCSSLNSVELFKVNENGEVVNIGRMNDEGHMVYGQFRIDDKYDLAATTTTAPTGDNNSVCYIKVNDGKTSNSPGVGIRIEPCAAPYIVNEGPIVSELDDIGFFYSPSVGEMGVYKLYHYNGSDAFDILVERPILASLWESEGFDALRKNNDDTVTLSYSQVMADGSTVIRSESVPVSAVREGSALTVPPVEVVETPGDAVETPGDAVETPGAPIGVVKKVGPDTYEISREFLEQIRKDPSLLRNNPVYGPLMKVKPIYKNEKIYAFQLSGIEDNSLYAQLGLQSGDMITEVNGQQVDSPEKIMAFLNTPKEGQDISLKIARSEEEKTLTYKIKAASDLLNDGNQ